MELALVIWNNTVGGVFLKGIISKVLDIFKQFKSNINAPIDTHESSTGIVTNPISQETKLSNRELKPLEIKEIYSGKDIDIIGGNVEIIRKSRGLTQKQLAESIGYKSASFISRLELWETEKITHVQVEKLAEGLNVDISEILHNWLRSRQ